MKLKSAFLLLLITSNFIFFQRKHEYCITIPVEENKNGKLENQIYTCYKFDWKIKVPDNYHVMDLKMIQKLEENGYDAIKESINGIAKIKRDPAYLISFGTDKINTFIAGFELLDKTKPQILNAHKNFTLRKYNDAYLKVEGMRVESSTSLLKLGKYDFYRIYGKVYNTKTNKLVLTQETYNSFIGDYLFNVSINYNNEKPEKNWLIIL